VKRIANRINTHGIFLYLTSQHMEEIVCELLPFHIFLYHQGGSKINHDIFRRNELMRVGDSEMLRQGWALDLLDTARVKLVQFREKWAPNFETGMRQSAYQRGTSASNRSHAIRQNSTSLGPTPGRSISKFNSSMERTSKTGASSMISMKKSKKYHDHNDISDSSDEESEEEIQPNEGFGHTGDEKIQSTIPNQNKISSELRMEQHAHSAPNPVPPDIMENHTGAIRRAQSVPADSGDPRKWDAQRLASWVRNQGQAYNPYFQNLVDNGIDGECLEEFGTAELQEAGLSPLHSKLILKKFASLLKKYDMQRANTS